VIHFPIELTNPSEFFFLTVPKQFNLQFEKSPRMLKKAIALITLISFIIYLYGCSTIEVVGPSEKGIEYYKDSKIISIVTSDNKVYEFDTKEVKPKPQIVDSLLIGWAIVTKFENEYTLREVKIPVSEIKVLSVEEVDVAKGIVSLIGVAVGLVGVLLLIWGITTNFEFDY